MNRSLKRSLERFENFVLGGTFIVMLAAMVTQVINRTIFKLPMPWLEELAVFAMLYMVFLGTEAGLRDGSQLSITLVQDRLKGRAKLSVQILGKAVVLAFSVVLMLASYRLVAQQMSSGQISPALQWPMWVPYASFLIAFVIIVVVQGIGLVLLVRAFIKNDESLGHMLDEETEDIDATVARERIDLADPNQQSPATPDASEEDTR